jgi:hypothetical protein
VGVFVGTDVRHPEVVPTIAKAIFINAIVAITMNERRTSCFCKTHCLSLILVTLLLLAPMPASPFENCLNRIDGGSGICPAGNTCCEMPDGSSGCISSDMGKLNATCCTDDGGGKTGCPPGYECRRRQNTGNPVCVVASGPARSPRSDPLTRILPRYKLCNANEIDTVHGLTVSSPSGERAALAYYSTHGPLEQLANGSSIEMVLIAMHGASRNADDYFCAAKATIQLQARFSEVLVLAPSFYSADDVRMGPFLYWDSADTDGSWRFGADSMGPIKYSSFDALDRLVATIRKHCPGVKQLTIAGHSSGGQVVQRWSLLTSWWNDSDGCKMHAVVANPSNYVYLTPRRFIGGRWRIPATCNSCPEYNEWEWGLGAGGRGDVPYRKRAVQNDTAVVEQYRRRSVVYLAGSADRCNVSQEAQGWCYSHGLETTCMDEMQGSNRFERNLRYIASLRKLGIWKGHSRILVPGVGHDHTMMFQSEEGLAALFYGPSVFKPKQGDIKQKALS